MKKICIVAILLFSCLSSCRKETKVCSDAYIRLYFLGFTPADLGDAYVLEYKKDNLFDSLVDSSKIDIGEFDPGSDTIISERGFDDKHDYKFMVPKYNLAYSVTGLAPGNNYTQVFNVSIFNTVNYGCVNNTVSYTLNGQQYGQPSVMTDNYNIVYINK